MKYIQRIKDSNGINLLNEINQDEFIFLIGNGINRYLYNKCYEDIEGSFGNGFSFEWSALIKKISMKVFKDGSPFINLSNNNLPENTLLLQLESTIFGNFKKELKLEISNWHQKLDTLFYENKLEIMLYLQKNSYTILTTNFDHFLHRENFILQNLSDSSGKKGGHYPWNTFFASQNTTNNPNVFRIFHIHGEYKNVNGIKWGMNDYVNSVSHARAILQKYRFYDTPSQIKTDTWLDDFFNKKIVMIGLGFSQSEVFLRWLLLQRMKYRQRIFGRGDENSIIRIITQNEYSNSYLKELRELNFYGIIDLLIVEDFEALYEEIWK